jgi:hypothetical protein
MPYSSIFSINVANKCGAVVGSISEEVDRVHDGKRSDVVLFKILFYSPKSVLKSIPQNQNG